MGKKKIIHHVAAVCFAGNKAFMVRTIDKDGKPLSGFCFPGGTVSDEKYLFQGLDELVSKRYKCPIRVLSPITPISRVDKDGVKHILHGFICLAEGKFNLPTKHYVYRYIDFESSKNLYLDPLHRILAEKVSLFAPIYNRPKRSVPLSQKEEAEAHFYLKSLFYFKDYVPSREISDFSLLIRADSNIKQIRRAYKWTLELCGCDYRQYLDALAYEEKKGKKAK